MDAQVLGPPREFGYLGHRRAGRAAATLRLRSGSPSPARLTRDRGFPPAVQ